MRCVGSRNFISISRISAKKEKKKTMIPKLVLLVTFFAIFLNNNNHVTLASDPDPVQDFCVPKIEQSQFCKNSSASRVEDFIYLGIKSSPKKFGPTGLAAMPVNSNTFPGLNTLGMSFVRADFEVGGVNPPHYHPRATEIGFLVEGRVYSGFIDTNNKIFAKVIEKGEVMVFPRGMIHFQMNIGDTPATILGSFDSQNPGLMKIPNAVFGSGIRDELLEKAFGLSSEEVSKLKKKFSS